MGASKTENYSSKHNDLARMLKALAHPARLVILEFLLKTEGCICSDIVKELPLAQPTVSQHLKAMKEAGLIHGNIEGKGICYCVEVKTLVKLQRFLTSVNTRLEQKKKNTCC